MRLFNPAAAVLLAPPLAPAAKTKPAPAIELGQPFADNPNLQRGKEVPVWGWSRPGTSVTVEFAAQKWNGHGGRGWTVNGEARATQGQRGARADEHQRRRWLQGRAQEFSRGRSVARKRAIVIDSR
jgi:hypothetical protein